VSKTNQLFQDEFERLYSETAALNNLHPDDDFEKIEEIMRVEYPHYFDDERSPI
jgi:hypothetical protein